MEKFELVIKTKNEILANNLESFQAQAEGFFNNLIPVDNLQTDDYSKLKDEVKELKVVEKSIKDGLDYLLNGNPEITKIVDVLNGISERSRNERLQREKLIKEEASKVKEQLLNEAFGKINAIRNGYESSVSIALEHVFSKDMIKKSLEDATKRRTTVESLTKALNAEVNIQIGLIAQECARLNERLKMIPIQYEYLFKDWVPLITSNDDLQAIVNERVEQEKQREQEKAQAQVAAQQSVQPEPMSDPTPPPQENPTSNGEQVDTYVYQVTFIGTREQAKEFFAPIQALKLPNSKIIKVQQ